MDANRAVASLYRINPTIQFEERRVTSINGVEYSHLDMKAFMRRYWYPYIATAYVVFLSNFHYILKLEFRRWLRQFVTTTLAFSSFAIPLEGAPSRDRLTVTVGLLITAQLGFKKDEGPITWLDSYVTVSFLMLAATMIYNGLALALVINTEVDIVIVAVLTGSWVVINIFYLAIAIKHVTKGRRKLIAWDTAAGFVTHSFASIRGTLKNS